MIIEKTIRNAIKEGRAVYIWGTGTWGSTLGLWFAENDLLLSGYVDSGQKKHGRVVMGDYKCIAPQEISGNSLIIITVAEEKINKEIQRRIEQISIEKKEKIVCIANCIEEICKMTEMLDDEKVIKTMYQAHMGYELNLDHPKRFNEKLNWLKLHDRKPIYTKMVDKYEVKAYIASIIGEKYVIPVLGVWDMFEDINFELLPNQFVLKCTHDSGGVVLCRDKSKFDKVAARKKINQCLKRNYYWWGREWPYKNIKPRIIAEEYLENNSMEGLHDYKIWCFNGEPLWVQYISGRMGEQTLEGFYDRKWRLQEFTYHNPIITYPVSKPEKLNELLKLSEKLSQGIPFLRCDFYVLPDGQIKFGEMTFYPLSGFEWWHPDKMDRILGDKIILPKDN